MANSRFGLTLRFSPGLSLVVLLACLPALSAQAALYSRAGGLAQYDDVLNITWLTDANYAMTSGYSVDGQMTWDDSLGFIQYLNDVSYLGVTGWRLPGVRPIDGTDMNWVWSTTGETDLGYNIGAPGTAYAGNPGSEMAHLFYTTLGGVGALDEGASPRAEYGLVDGAGPFSNLTGSFWYGDEKPNDPARAVRFQFDAGYQNYYAKIDLQQAWGVLDGDVLATSAVPLPASAWFFGSALLGLLGLRRS